MVRRRGLVAALVASFIDTGHDSYGLVVWS